MAFSLVTEKNESFWSQMGFSHMWSYYILHGNYCYWDATIGKNHSSLFYITTGSVVFNMPLKKVEAKAGDYLFMPAGLRYFSVWHGNPTASFYSVDFDLKKTAGRIFDRALDISVINCVDGKRALADIKYIYEIQNLPQKDITADKILKAVSVFYALFADSMPDILPSSDDDIPDSLKKSIVFLENNYKNDVTAEQIAKAGFISESRMYHLFTEHFKCTPIEYKNKLKIQDAIEMLTQTSLSIEEIAEKLGFNSSAYFRKVFKDNTGLSPRDCRKLK